jgi:hypothetical protein
LSNLEHWPGTLVGRAPCSASPLDSAIRFHLTQARLAIFAYPLFVIAAPPANVHPLLSPCRAILPLTGRPPVPSMFVFDIAAYCLIRYPFVPLREGGGGKKRYRRGNGEEKNGFAQQG